MIPRYSFAGKEERILLARLEALKKEYSNLQTTLQQVTEKRWSARQKQVEQKEKNKTELDRIRQEIERLYSDVARAREGLLTRENALSSEKETVDEKAQDWEYLQEAVEDKRGKESKRNLTSFPIGQDTRMAQLAEIEQMFAGKSNTLEKLRELLRYKIQIYKDAKAIGLGRRTFITEDNQPVTAQVLTIGRVMAYAVDPDGNAYYLSRIGGTPGQNPFKWKKVTTPAIAEPIAKMFPGIIENKRVDGALPADVLQSTFSGELIAGKSESWITAFLLKWKKGGPVMVPLALIILWGLALIILKLYSYRARHNRDYSFIEEALKLLDQKQIEKARNLAKEGSCILAKILGVILRHADQPREEAEKSVKEMLLEEVGVLEKHLNTIAVLAGAAPLLGLLGTVTGMITMFEAITRFGTADPKLLAGGISEALITTQIGLVIAIPLLLFHNFLRNRRNRIQSDMETYTMKIMNKVWGER
jgi:biopolymer transport protein ExbB